MHVNVTEFDSDIVRVCGFIAGLGETEVEKKIDYETNCNDTYTVLQA